MDINLVIAKNADMGNITREFAEAIRDFGKKIDKETAQLENQVGNYGISGSDALAQKIKNAFEEKIGIVRESKAELEKLIPKLEENAAGYDQIISDLYRSLLEG